MALTRAYRNGVLAAENYPVEDVSVHLAERDTLVWVDLGQPEATDLQLVADELGVHALALEDAVHTRQRPKLDRYATHEFLSWYAVRFDAANRELFPSEIAAFITPHALVTIRKDSTFDIDRVVARWDDSADLIKQGEVGALLYETAPSGTTTL